MKNRRLATTGVALVAALALGLTGCGNQTGADTPAAGGADTPEVTTAPASALDKLTAATLKLNEESMRLKIDSSFLKSTGLMDPKSKTADMTMDMGGQGKIRFMIVGNDAYLKVTGMSGSGLPDKWMHMDATKLGPESRTSLMPDGDAGGAKKMVDGIVEVTETGTNSFSGTLDYTKANPGKKEIAALGEKAKKVPFTAKVDDEGRLTQLVVDTSVLQQSLGKLTTTYSDFGVDVKAEKPAASETAPAPESLVKAFGN
ncbi:hypothetical protein K7640_16595 [Micromonospora sp. PLK6-60]|uniref:hypothetical protein n=1 Tax=Micromonospora sp. PLK6-60 TaxID=2873383 RepID=UPI001CA61CC3|nr:hypothetical protein [Micromonospora sp. PLK6-60]MBY8873455.1 hypothetical protein [Micromonospora sp. PLK6-60]